MTRALLTLALLAAGGMANAQSCGDTITSDVTLSADLHCDTGWVALYVPTSGVTINLNGHTLSGSADLTGVQVLDAGSVSIINGNLKGFWTGVNGLRAHHIRMQGLVFKDMPSGTHLNFTSGAQILDNDFVGIDGIAISMAVPIGAGYGAAGYQTIAYNRFEDVGGGIQLCGYDNRSAVIAKNDFRKVRDYAIHFEDGSGGHYVGNNVLEDIENTAIVLRASRGNRVESNLISHGRQGIAMTPQFSSKCKKGPLTSPQVRDNIVNGNSLFKLEDGAVLGMGPPGKPLVFKNRINNNKFYYSETGLYFQADAHHNDATGNGYADTTYPVVDEGYGNSY